MSITNGYCDLPEIKQSLTINDEGDNPELELSVEVASRQIDNQCGPGRRFWQDSTVVARTYYPSEARRVFVDDISTTTGLIVKVDENDDGTFETTLTINTDFIVEPVNAAAQFPVEPYTSIRLLDGALSSFSALSSGRPSVQVTAKFGWVTVPQAIKRATILQARQVFKAIQTQNGLLQQTVDGSVVRMPVIDPIARLSIEPFIRYLEVDDGA